MLFHFGLPDVLIKILCFEPETIADTINIASKMTIDKNIFQFVFLVLNGFRGKKFSNNGKMVASNFQSIFHILNTIQLKFRLGFSCNIDQRGYNCIDTFMV